ncbi:MAG: hypothetical protein AVDCRST_MAG30-1911, partial [uncultured Solirubrobacteraceae bacterium]
GRRRGARGGPRRRRGGGRAGHRRRGALRPRPGDLPRALAHRGGGDLAAGDDPRGARRRLAPAPLRQPAAARGGAAGCPRRGRGGGRRGDRQRGLRADARAGLRGIHGGRRGAARPARDERLNLRRRRADEGGV